MKSILLSLSCLISFNLLAQPVIPNANNMPAPGMIVPVSQTTVTNVGPGGANQTWDFSAAPFLPVGNAEVITPASSPIGSSFPNANYALSLQGQNNYSFFTKSATKLEVLAWTITTPGIGNDYSPNPKTVLKFPFNYMDSETDTWQKVGGSPSTVTISYDGYGTLVMPGATYTDVVRIKEDYGGASIDYAWFILNPLTQVAIFDHNNARLYHFGTTQITTSTSSIEKANSTITIYPNPCTNQITLSGLPSRATVHITDITGKQIACYDSSGDKLTIDTKSYAGGVYIAHVAQQAGFQSYQKFVVE